MTYNITMYYYVHMYDSVYKVDYRERTAPKKWADGHFEENNQFEIMLNAIFL